MYEKNYNSFYYWDALKDKEDLFEGGFNGLPLTKKSIFVNTVIFNNGDILSGWAHYPNAKSLLGFIKYVFLSSAFFNWFVGDKENSVICTVSDPSELVDMLVESDEIVNKTKVNVMKENIEDIDEFWELEEDKCFESLKKYLDRFNKDWTTDSHVFFHLNIYKSPRKIAEYLITDYEKEGMYDLFEKDIKYTKDQFWDIVDNVYGNKFMEYKFIDILNNELPILI